MSTMPFEECCTRCTRCLERVCRLDEHLDDDGVCEGCGGVFAQVRRRVGGLIRGTIKMPLRPQTKRPGSAAKRSPGLADLHCEERSTVTIVSAEPTSVYRYFDHNNLLLYVGITARATQRQREHNADKAWWSFVARQEVEHYATRPQALERERYLIRKFRPPFNVQHNPGHVELRELYLAVGQVTAPAAAFDSSIGYNAALAFRDVKGKVPMTQVESGNVAQFAISSAFTPLLSTHVNGKERVLLRTPRKRGYMTHLQLFTTPPTAIFVGDRGGIPLLVRVHLHMKVVSQRPFVTRIHEAVGEVA